MSTVVVTQSVQPAIEDFPRRWFAVYTNSHHEKRIHKYLQDSTVETYLPLYDTTRKWKNGCKVQLNLPLFPNYVFVRIQKVDRLRVLQTPGVIKFLSAGQELLEIDGAEMALLQAGLAHYRYEPHPFLKIGERVRVKRGPMEGLTGILIRKSNATRLIISLELLMRSVAVEVDGTDLEACPCN